MNDKTKLKTEMLATKVSAEAKGLFDHIAKRKGITGYELLNLMISAIVKYCDGDHQLSPDLERVIAIFDNLQGWDSMTSIAGVGRKRDVIRAIYMLEDESGQRGKARKGAIAVMVDKPFMGEKMSTYNVQRIVDEVLKTCTPYLYKRLQQASEELECNTIVETISTLIELHGPDPDGDYIRSLFADDRRSEYGRPVDQTKYVQHRNSHQMELFVDKD